MRGWKHRPYYGQFISGIALGALVSTAVGVAPVAPGPNLCCYWTNPAMTRGYGDYCY